MFKIRKKPKVEMRVVDTTDAIPRLAQTKKHKHCLKCQDIIEPRNHVIYMENEKLAWETGICNSCALLKGYEFYSKKTEE